MGIESLSTPILSTVHKEPPKNFGHGEVTFMRSAPDAIKTDMSTDAPVIPLLFVQGHGQDPTLERYLQLFAQTGRDTVGVSFTGRRTSTDSRLENVDGMDSQAAPYQVEKAEDMIAAMNAAGIGQTDIIATSEGALRAMIAIAKYPDRFRNILLVHPAGMDDKGYIRTHLRVAYHYGRKALRSLITPRKPREDGIAGGAEGFKDKGLRETRVEQKTVARTKFDMLIPELTAANPHLLFSMVGDSKDGVYPAERLKHINGPYLFEFMTSEWDGHGIGIRQDRVNQLDTMLTRMERSRSRK